MKALHKAAIIMKIALRFRKAKLEAVESGISTVEREFFYDVVLPDGKTIGEWMAPQLETAYQTGTMPPMLPML